MVLFGQLVIGPPGAGKTTFCNGMKMFLEAIGRNCIIVNLDFANDNVPYTSAIDVRELISMEDTMETLELGPNGSLVYCMEYLLAHSDWLIQQIEEKMLDSDSTSNSNSSNEDNKSNNSGGVNYVLIDCPGQVELFTHYTCVQDLIHEHLCKAFDLRLTCVHLVDSVACCNVSTFLSAALLVTATMYRIALPHVSVLTKVDLLATVYRDSMPFTIDFFTECTNFLPLSRYVDAHIDNKAFSEGVGEDDLQDYENDEDENIASGDAKLGRHSSSSTLASSILFRKHRKMTEGLCELLNSYEMVSFLPCSIEDPESVARVLTTIDKANGYSLAVVEARQMISSSNSSSSSGRTWGAAGQGQGQVYTNVAVDQETEDSYARSGLQIVEKFQVLHEMEQNQRQDAADTANMKKMEVGAMAQAQAQAQARTMNIASTTDSSGPQPKRS